MNKEIKWLGSKVRLLMKLQHDCKKKDPKNAGNVFFLQLL